MKLEAITLVLTMTAGTLLTAAWSASEPQTSPEAALATPMQVQNKGTPYWEYVPLPEDVARGPAPVLEA